MVATDLEMIAAELSAKVSKLEFGPPVNHVYNPLDYAWEFHAEYLRRYGGGPKEVLLVGMNPGPWGMAQTGVPFGEVAVVRDWLGFEGEIRPTGGRAPETTRPRSRLPAKRGLRSPSLGLGERHLCHPRTILREVLRRKLLSAPVPRGERPQSHPRQAQTRRAAASVSGVRRGAAFKRCRASTPPCHRRRRLRRRPGAIRPR